MPHATLDAFNLNNKTPKELEERRSAIITEMQTKYRGYDDPEVPEELLNELAVVTISLRRKNAGPPKEPRARRTNGVKVSTDDLMI